MSLSAVVAHNLHFVIGHNNRLPWHLPPDLKRFKTLTMGHPIIMGRKTFESIGRPLPGRENWVLSKNKTFSAPTCVVLSSRQEVLNRLEKSRGFIIGGAHIYELFWPDIDTLYVTRIEKECEGDTFFPRYTIGEDFEVVEDSLHQYQELTYHFLTLKRC